MLKSESYRKGAVLSSAFNIVAQLIGYSKNVVIAFYFGAGDATDVYFYVYLLFVSLTEIISCVDSAVIIPQLMRFEAQRDHDTAIAFANLFLYIFVLLSLLVFLVIQIIPGLVLTWFSDFSAQVVNENLAIIRVMAIVIVLQMFVKYATNILSAYKYFTMPMVISIVNNVAVMVLILVLGNVIGTVSVGLGIVLGLVINSLLLIWLLDRRLGWRLTVRFVNPGTQFIRNVTAVIAAQFFTFVNSFVPRFVFSSLGNGIISSMEYGQRTAMLPNSLITNQITAVLGIKLNELSATNDQESFKKILIEAVDTIMFVLAPIVSIGAVFSDQIIATMYGHGNFSSSNVSTTAFFLMVYVLYLPIYALNSVVTRIIISRQDNVFGSIYQVAFNLLAIPIYYFSIKLLGVSGLGLSLAILGVLHLCGMAYIYRRFHILDGYLLGIVNALKYFALTLPLTFLSERVIAYYCGSRNPSKLIVLLSLGIVTLVHGIYLIGINEIFGFNRFINKFVNKTIRSLIHRSANVS